MEDLRQGLAERHDLPLEIREGPGDVEVGPSCDAVSKVRGGGGKVFIVEIVAAHFAQRVEGVELGDLGRKGFPTVVFLMGCCDLGFPGLCYPPRGYGGGHLDCVGGELSTAHLGFGPASIDDDGNRLWSQRRESKAVNRFWEFFCRD